MMYNNPYMNNPYAVQYQPPIMQPQQQITPSTANANASNGGIIWVQGEAGAKSYLVAPSCSVLLMDSENDYFYIKSADQSGMPSLRKFQYFEATNSNLSEKAGYNNVMSSQNGATNAQTPDLSIYVTHDELKAEIEKITVSKARTQKKAEASE